MTEDNKGIALAVMAKELAKIWAPGVEAMRLQKELNVQSLKETSGALERAGYRVYQADLPRAVSGFAAIIYGERYIVVGRCESPKNQQYTISHELGHHVLHLDPSPAVQRLGLEDKVDPEFQADLFASVWLMRTTKGKQREEALRRNPSARIALTTSVMMTIFVVLPCLLIHVCSRLFLRDPSV